MNDTLPVPERCPYTLPTRENLYSLFLQKYGTPLAVGWMPRNRLRFGYYLPSDVYEAVVSKFVAQGSTWLDVGGGHAIFAENPGLATELVDRCTRVVAVDPSP